MLCQTYGVVRRPQLTIPAADHGFYPRAYGHGWVLEMPSSLSRGPARQHTVSSDWQTLGFRGSASTDGQGTSYSRLNALTSSTVTLPSFVRAIAPTLTKILCELSISAKDRASIMGPCPLILHGVHFVAAGPSAANANRSCLDGPSCPICLASAGITSSGRGRLHTISPESRSLLAATRRVSRLINASIC